MDTTVTIEVVGCDEGCRRQVQEAFDWFAFVEDRCNRFDPRSELSRLSCRRDEPVPVSDLLFEAIALSLRVSRASKGAFSPVLGREMELLGFNRNYLTGETIGRSFESSEPATYRDVGLDPLKRTVTLLKPLALDLNAVAKGFAIDLAARQLASFDNYVVNAGGDIFARGHNRFGEPWRIGIRNPRETAEVITMLGISGLAVCTSGDYERPSPDKASGHHVIDPQSGRPVTGAASVTVVAPTASAADALSTAAFVLGPERGLAFLESEGVDGLIVTEDLEVVATPGFARLQV